MKHHQVIFQPSGRRGGIPEGTTVLEAARMLGVGIEALCSGQKSCGKCLVRLETGRFERYGIASGPGHLSPFTAEEAPFIGERERQEGYRLACAASVLGDLLLFVPETSRTGAQVVRKEAGLRETDLNPAVRLFTVTLAPPGLTDARGDYERLAEALCASCGLPAPPAIDRPALLALPAALRRGNWTVTAALWMEQEILAVFPGRQEEAWGLAVDIGTTTVAGYLCSLATGSIAAVGSLMNPQVAFGEDVISRITYATEHPGGLAKLHGAIIGGLNGLIRSVTAEAGLAPEDLLDLTVVGNTAMHHLFLGIDPASLGRAPFPPAIHRSLDLKARDLGIAVHAGATVHVLPIEAGFVGADNVGVLVAEEPDRREEISLIIDVGTNGEMNLGNRCRLLSTSCATGPALEGAHIRFGMRAAPGAIERVRIDPQTREVTFQVIGQDDGQSESGRPGALGLCGSGIIDAVAELFRAGVVDRTGRFREGIATPRLRRDDDGRMEFVIAWPAQTALGRAITLTQQDVRSVQLAKGALYTGAKLMMKTMGIDRIDRVVLAGAFGSHIDKISALRLGMFPDCDPAAILSVGNAAGDGARFALLNREARRKAEAVARKTEHLELNLLPEFQEAFLASLTIPHMEDPFPHLPAAD
jgi:uncharacterized 2Fe-2S/4Fe-4S cluster protein (DUF4445 family)